MGVIENTSDSKQTAAFIQLVRDLEPPGQLSDNVSYDFAFSRVEKQYESYFGSQVKLR